MSLAKYAIKFKDISAYSNQSIYASNEWWKINQFMFGLRGEIEHIMAQWYFNTYAELLRQCYVVEYNLKKIRLERDQSRQGQGDQGRDKI